MTATMTPPTRSLAQRMDALDRANEIRSHRAHVKRQLKAGRTTFPAVLADPMFATAKVADVLMAVPKVGRVRAYEALGRSRISLAKSCEGLTDRQRRDLAQQLNGRLS